MDDMKNSPLTGRKDQGQIAESYGFYYSIPALKNNEQERGEKAENTEKIRLVHFRPESPDS